MRTFKILATTFLFSLSAYADRPVVKLSADAADYMVGATAHLEARALVFPHNSSDDFFIGSTLNGQPLPLNQSPHGQGIGFPHLVNSGTYVWTVQLFLENSKLAASLNDTISSLSLANDQIDTEISSTSDPARLATLRAKEAANNIEITQANQELAQIRIPFGASQSLNFTAH